MGTRGRETIQGWTSSAWDNGVGKAHDPEMGFGSPVTSQAALGVIGKRVSQVPEDILCVLAEHKRRFKVRLSSGMVTCVPSPSRPRPIFAVADMHEERARHGTSYFYDV